MHHKTIAYFLLFAIQWTIVTSAPTREKRQVVPDQIGPIRSSIRGSPIIPGINDGQEVDRVAEKAYKNLVILAGGEENLKKMSTAEIQALIARANQRQQLINQARQRALLAQQGGAGGQNGPGGLQLTPEQANALRQRLAGQSGAQQLTPQQTQALRQRLAAQNAARQGGIKLTPQQANALRRQLANQNRGRPVGQTLTPEQARAVRQQLASRNLPPGQRPLTQRQFQAAFARRPCAAGFLKAVQADGLKHGRKVTLTKEQKQALRNCYATTTAPWTYATEVSVLVPGLADLAPGPRAVGNPQPGAFTPNPLNGVAPGALSQLPFNLGQQSPFSGGQGSPFSQGGLPFNFGKK